MAIWASVEPSQSLVPIKLQIASKSILAIASTRITAHRVKPAVD